MDENTFDKFDRSNLDKVDLKILNDFQARRNLFDNFLSQHSIKLFTCAGCGYPTLTEREGYEICRVCNWEDDGQDDKEADEIWGGPNYELSLTENRLRIGRQLKEIAEKVDGEINTDPKSILEMLSGHEKSIGEILNKIPDEANLNHPLVNQYNLAGQELLKSLVTN